VSQGVITQQLFAIDCNIAVFDSALNSAIAITL